ncbi:MAG: carotenoid oxygenase family protein [Halobacteriaceae archaeon]
MSPDYALGFRSAETERADVDCRVEGDLPSWLSGTLLRNGPAKFEVGGRELDHWFDGLAMLTRYAVDGASDEVRYGNRFLRSDEYRAATSSGTVAAGQFGSGPDAGPLGSLLGLALPKVTDNANVHVQRVAGEHVAVTETPRALAFDPRTLETLGHFEYDDRLDGHTRSPHPVRDPRREETVGLTTRFGPTSEYRLLRRPDGARSRDLFARVEADVPAYLHSFALTDRHAVLTEHPLVVHPLRLLLSGGDSFVDRLSWEPERGTRFRVVDRATGEVVAAPRGDPCFVFHHVGAHDDGDEVVVDLVAFEDADAVTAMSLSSLRAGDVGALRGELRRYRLPLDGGAPTYETAFEAGLTLPRTNETRWGEAERHVYGQGLDPDEPTFANRLVKVTVPGGESRAWSDADCYCGEPVFVPRPGGTAPDDGAVLAVALNVAAERSELVVLDGADMTERARAALPHVVPFDFHGRFFRSLK